MKSFVAFSIQFSALIWVITEILAKWRICPLISFSWFLAQVVLHFPPAYLLYDTLLHMFSYHPLQRHPVVGQNKMCLSYNITHLWMSDCHWWKNKHSVKIIHSGFVTGRGRPFMTPKSWSCGFRMNRRQFVAWLKHNKCKISVFKEVEWKWDRLRRAGMLSDGFERNGSCVGSMVMVNKDWPRGHELACSMMSWLEIFLLRFICLHHTR